MTFEGILLNGAVTLFAGGCYLYVAQHVARSKGQWLSAVVILFALVGAALVLAGVRQGFVYVGTVMPSFLVADVFTYRLLAVPATFAMAAFAHLATRVWTGSARKAAWVAAAFVGLSIVGLAFLYAAGFDGPTIDAWGGEYEPRSIVAKVMLFGVMTIPAVLASALLIHTGYKVGGQDGHRIRLVGWSCLLCFGGFTLDTLGVQGVAFLVLRLVMVGAAAIAYFAYAPDPFARPSVAA